MRGLIAFLGLAALAAPTAALAQEPVSEPAVVETETMPIDGVVAYQAAPAAAGNDPWEGMNRDLYAVHNAVDGAVLEPIARGYRAVTPRFARTGVSNFLRNLRSPAIFANDVLQAEPTRSATTAGRFGINTTIGILGLFDPATSMGLERHDEDFGQTLAVWGLESGPYIFVPLMGPTTVRDATGKVIDIVFDPLTWAEFDNVDEARVARTVLAGVAARESVIEAVEDLETSIDPYVSIRSSYFLLRESAIQNGQADVQELPDFEEIPNTPASE
ncbi:MAG: VacJ family lipoprotein [Hyphomonadaceae bacterium]